MAQSAAEVETLIADLQHQYKALSREYSETHKKEKRDELSDILSSIDYQICRLEEQWREFQGEGPFAAAAGA